MHRTRFSVLLLGLLLSAPAASEPITALGEGAPSQVWRFQGTVALPFPTTAVITETVSVTGTGLAEVFDLPLNTPVVMIGISGTGMAATGTTPGANAATLMLSGGIDPFIVFPTSVITTSGTTYRLTVGGGSPPMPGSLRLCLLGPCPAVPTLTLGLTALGENGLNLEVSATTPAFRKVSVGFAPWQVGQVSVGTQFSKTTATGFVHGPASASSTWAQTSGVIQLVSPVNITWQNDPFPRENWGIAQYTMHFIPEPGALALLTLGAAGLALLGWRRR